MKLRIAPVLGVLILLAQAGWTADGPEKAATTSAESWLALVDQAKHAESWDAAARYFQGATTSDQWKATAAGVRAPLGKLLTRSVRSATFKTSLPGVPDGRYVTILFDATFENKKEAVEIVTTTEEDGAWKVAGYFIR